MALITFMKILKEYGEINNVNYFEKYNNWLLGGFLSVSDKNELFFIKDDDEAIKDRFYKDLEFGTGGLRGVMGIGTNRINIYTIRKATQGLADFLCAENTDNLYKGVAIAYDSRHYSNVFAMEAALVLAANGIKVYLFESMRSTPELSFTVRHLGCLAGIVVTASHNPSEYNGYKVYGKDGGQITLEHANSIIAKINSINEWAIVKTIEEKYAIQKGLLEIVSKKVDEQYIDAVCNLALSKRLSKNQSDLRIVYTPLHGTGLMPVSESLKRLGYEKLYIVESQAIGDGSFPTVKSPNPEEHKAFEEGIKLGEDIKADIILGTDPDCDRVGVAVKNYKGRFQVLTGNQVGALLVDYIIKATNNLSSKHAIVKTIVTSELGEKIAQSSGVTVFNTLTGFKFIGEKIKEFENDNSYEFLFGYEESYGYLAGTFVRDKDAVITCSLISEMAAYYKEQDIGLYQALQNINDKYGYFLEKLEAITLEGADGMQKIKEIMEKFREREKILNSFSDAYYIQDYLNSNTFYKDKSVKQNITLPKSDVIKIVFDNGSWVAARPSGTEPKIKIYYSACGKNLQQADCRIIKMKNEISNIIK